MSNEILGKFREMMEKKKSLEGKRTGTPMPDLPTRTEESENTNNFEKEKIVDSTIQSDNSTISTTISTNLDTPNNLTGNTPVYVSKPRNSIFNLAKKFEKRDEEENNKSVKNASVGTISKKNDTFTDSETLKDVTDNYSSNNSENNNKDPIIKGRTSTNKNMIRNSLQKLNLSDSEREEIKDLSGKTCNVSFTDREKEKVNYSPNYAKINTNISTSSGIDKVSSTNANTNPNTNTDVNDLSAHIITELPRKSVHSIIQMNEKRIRHSIEEKKKQGQRHSVTQKFKTNMNDIAKYLQSLRESPEERIDSEEFLKRNAQKLKQFGINEKDLPLVQELVTFYAEKEKDYSPNQRDFNMKKRNTVSFKSLNLNVPTITEEIDEEAASQGDSMRKSSSQRDRNSLYERKSNNNSTTKNIASTIKEEIDKLSNKSKSSEDSFVSADSFDEHQLQMDFAGDSDDFATFKPLKDDLTPTRNNNINTADIIRNDIINLDKYTNENKSGLQNELQLTYRQEKLNRYSSYNKILFDNQSEKVYFNENGKEKLRKRNSSLALIKVGSFVIENEDVNKNLSDSLKIVNKIGEVFVKSKSEGKKKNQMASERVNDFFFICEGKRKFDANFVVKNESEGGIMGNAQNNKDYDNTNYTKEKQKIVKNFLEDNDRDRDREDIIKSRAIVNPNMMRSNRENEDYDALEKQSLEILVENLAKNEKNEKNEKNVTKIEKIEKTEENMQKTEKTQKTDENNVNIHIHNFLTENNTTSRYQKNIINSLDAISVTQYNINSSLPLDPSFFDVLCINCYECVKYTDIDLHSEFCIIQTDEIYQDMYLHSDDEEDYNSRIYKLHESLKSKQGEIYKTKDGKLVSLYEELASLIYEILINNNSIEELDKSISTLNEILNSKLSAVRSNYKFTLLIFAQRISQLVYTKLKDMEKILLCVKKSGKNLGDSSDDDIGGDEEEQEEGERENQEHIQILKMELANLERQTMTAKEEIEQWRKESKMLENLLRRPNVNSEMLSDIVSDVASRRDESFDQMTMVTGQTSEYDTGDIANMTDINEVLDLNNEEELKKYFLSIGLSLKFKYADKITENVSIADLYDKARERHVPISDWYNFICQELKLN